MDMKKQFAKNFKECFEKSNITQEELCEKMKKNGVKIDRSQISFWLNAKTTPRLDKVPALAKALNCSIGDLLKF